MQLFFETCHIVLGNDLWMYFILDRIVLGRQTKGIPAHRIQYVVALHSSLSGYDIQCSVRTRMSNVQTLS